MELQFGRLLGEDPKLTLAKILARKANPDVSFLDVEKSFIKNKGKLDDYMIKMQTDHNVERQSSVSPRRIHLPNQKTDEGKLNLSRPTMNREIKARRPQGKPSVVETPPDQLVGNMKGVKSNITILSSQKVQNTVKGAQPNLSRPVMNKDVNATRLAAKPALSETQSNPLSEAIDKGINVSLRKPSVVQDDGIGLEKNPKLKIKWNLLLKTRKGSAEKFSDSALLKKPEMTKMPLNPDIDCVSSGGAIHEIGTPHDDVNLLTSPKTLHDNLEVNREEILAGIQQRSLDQSADRTMNVVSDVTEIASGSNSEFIPESSISDGVINTGLRQPRQSGATSHLTDASVTSVDQNSMDEKDVIYGAAPLLGKPTRLDPPVKDVSLPSSTGTSSLADEGHKYDAVVDHLPVDKEGHEASDWKRAEHLLRTCDRGEVELISCNGKGFVVSFGSLIGFLPYRNLGAKWKFLAFESWLRKKGLDPSMYRQNLSVLGGYDVQTSNLPLDSNKNQDTGSKYEETLPTTMKFDDLLEAYDQEKTKFLSSFIGQKIRVSVVVADINSRRLLFTGRLKEKEESVEKKRNLMAKLRVGDIVKCRIKKITYFGIFVEVEEVPALIHQTELSWDATLDLSSFYKIDQIIEAKVHQLDYALERISLSLREVTPDPLTEALESVVGDQTSIGGSLEAAQSDVEWDDVESLIKELQQIDGVRSVSKGRFFLSPGLAPTFQVYMASMFETQYKLLARYENKVQEVLVQASLDKEQMKDAILTSTNRVV